MNGRETDIFRSPEVTDYSRVCRGHARGTQAKANMQRRPNGDVLFPSSRWLKAQKLRLQRQHMEDWFRYLQPGTYSMCHVVFHVLMLCLVLQRCFFVFSASGTISTRVGATWKQKRSETLCTNNHLMGPRICCLAQQDYFLVWSRSEATHAYACRELRRSRHVPFSAIAASEEESCTRDGTPVDVLVHRRFSISPVEAASQRLSKTRAASC